VDLASDRVKSALQKLWTDSATIIEYAENAAPDGSTGFAEKTKTVLKNIPCKLSFSTVQAVDQNADAAITNQTIKLFLDKAVKVTPGSKVIITRGADTFVFAFTGEPGIFHNHQEITLTSWERYA